MGDMVLPQSTSATNKVPTSNGEDLPVPGGIEYIPPTESTSATEPELMGEPLPPMGAVPEN